MDTGQVMSVLLRGALGRSGRKRSRRARRFLTGHAGFLTASTLMTAAGLAWGIFDSVKAGATPSAAGAPMPPDPVLPPPLPGVAAAADAGLPAEVLRLVRLAVSAARADGALSPPERALILARAREAGIEHAVAAEVDSARPLGDIVAGVHDSRQREELYVLAFTIVRADETVTGGERVYLAQLAHHLGLDAATAARLEQQTAAAIDATPDEPDTTPDEAGATGA